MHGMSNTDLIVDGMTRMPLVLALLLLWSDATAALNQRRKEEGEGNDAREMIT
jgi:hypothetical protein